VGKIIHSLVEASVECNFDSTSFHIVPEKILGGVGEESKKYSFARMIAELAAARTRGSNPDTATEGAKIAKVWFGAVIAFERGRSVLATRQSIFDAKVGMKCIRPKLGIKARAGKHSTEGIANGLMSALDRTVLVGTIRTGRSDIIAMALEEATNFWIVVKFAALVKKNILSR
jgi:hypothetical protein